MSVEKSLADQFVGNESASANEQRPAMTNTDAEGNVKVAVQLADSI